MGNFYKDEHKVRSTGYLISLSYYGKHTPKLSYKRKSTNSPVRGFVQFANGGSGGIRTPVGFHPNGFQDRLVVTASIHFQIFSLFKLYQLHKKLSITFAASYSCFCSMFSAFFALSVLIVALPTAISVTSVSFAATSLPLTTSVPSAVDVAFSAVALALVSTLLR